MTLRIESCGLVSPLGTGVHRVSAAWRGGVTGLHAHPWMVSLQGTAPIVGAALPVDARPDVRRWTTLLTNAIRDSVAGVSPDALQRPVRVLIVLPSARPGRPLTLERDAADAVATALHKRATITHIEPVLHDECGGIVALQLAEAHLHAGERCLIVGVDSWIDPDAIEMLDMQQRLVGGGHDRITLWGSIPGEAAAAIWVTRELDGAEGPARGGMRVLGTGVTAEPNAPRTHAVISGHALANAVAQSAPQVRRFDAVLSDAGAAPWRAEEWGLASLRLSMDASDDLTLLTPADRWGDLGAASGPAMLALASDLLSRRPLVHGNTLLTTSSEAGVRAAALLVGDAAHTLSSAA